MYKEEVVGFRKNATKVMLKIWKPNSLVSPQANHSLGCPANYPNLDPAGENLTSQ